MLSDRLVNDLRPKKNLQEEPTSVLLSGAELVYDKNFMARLGE